MRFMFKFFYIGVLITTMVQGPGQVAAMLLDHTPTHGHGYHSSYNALSTPVTHNSGYAKVCQSLNSMQDAAYDSRNSGEARAIGLYRDIIASAAGRNNHC